MCPANNGSAERRQRGTVTAVMILEEGSEIISTRLDRVRVTERGFEGDRHAGLTRPATGRDKGVEQGTPMPNDRQVSLVSTDELAQVAGNLGIEEVRPEWLGANLALSGIPDLTRVAAGTRLTFEGGVELVVTEENKPCTGPGQAVQTAYPAKDGLKTGFPKAALGRRGLVARVVKGGIIEAGESVTASIPGPAQA